MWARRIAYRHAEVPIDRLICGAVASYVHPDSRPDRANTAAQYMTWWKAWLARSTAAPGRPHRFAVCYVARRPRRKLPFLATRT